MIKASELRVGNYVFHEADDYVRNPYKLNIYDMIEVYDCLWNECVEDLPYKPLVLTE